MTMHRYTYEVEVVPDSIWDYDGGNLRSFGFPAEVIATDHNAAVDAVERSVCRDVMFREHVRTDTGMHDDMPFEATPFVIYNGTAPGGLSRYTYHICIVPDFVLTYKSGMRGLPRDILAASGSEAEERIRDYIKETGTLDVLVSEDFDGELEYSYDVYARLEWSTP